MEAILATEDVKTWTDRLETAGVATAPMNRLDQVLQDEQVLANEMVIPAARPDGSTVDLLGLPFKLSGTLGQPGAAPGHLAGQAGSDRGTSVVREAGHRERALASRILRLR